MRCESPTSPFTIKVTEAGINEILNIYREQRPEEFQLVSRNLLDSNEGVEPINVTDEDLLDYSIKIGNVEFDLHPPNVGSISPNPPKPDECGVRVDVDIQFAFSKVLMLATPLKDPSSPLKDFKGDLTFWFRFTLETDTLTNPISLSIKLLEVRIIKGELLPDALRLLLEDAAFWILDHALSEVRIPTTVGIENFANISLYEEEIVENFFQIFLDVIPKPKSYSDE